MPKITITHPEVGPQKTYTSASVAAAAESTYVDNNDDFAASDLVMLGKYGQEKTEITTLSGVTSTNQIDHAALTFPHPAKTPVYQLLYNQAEIYRATAQGGSYSLITTVDLNVDEEDTIYNDTGGTTSSWYKIRYKNSVATTYSDYSDEVQGTGFTEDSLRSMSDEVLTDFGDPDAKEITRLQVANYLNAGVRRLMMQIIKTYPDYGGAYTTQSLSASTTYSYPTNFISFKRINIGTSLTDSYRAEFIKENELDPTLTYSELNPKVVMRDATWKTYPDCAGSTAYIWYWQYPSTMSDDEDEHGLAYGARDVLVTFALYKCWLTKDLDRASTVKRLLDEQIKEWIDFVGQSRQASNNYFQELTFGVDDYVY